MILSVFNHLLVNLLLFVAIEKLGLLFSIGPDLIRISVHSFLKR